MSKTLIRTTITMQKGVHAKGEHQRKLKNIRNFSLYLEDLVRRDTGLDTPSHPARPVMITERAFARIVNALTFAVFALLLAIACS